MEGVPQLSPLHLSPSEQQRLLWGSGKRLGLGAGFAGQPSCVRLTPGWRRLRESAAALPPRLAFRAWRDPEARAISSASELAHCEPPLPRLSCTINRHHVASFYDKVRGNGSTGSGIVVEREPSCPGRMESRSQLLASPGASFGCQRFPDSQQPLCPELSLSLLMGLQTPSLPTWPCRACGSPGSFSDRAVSFYC